MTDASTLTTTAADGTTVRALDEGQGRVILILHPRMETGTRYQRVAAILARRLRVIRLHRRQYRRAHRTRLVSRLLFNAQLYDPVPPQAAHKPGPKPTKVASAQISRPGSCARSSMPRWTADRDLAFANITKPPGTIA